MPICALYAGEPIAPEYEWSPESHVTTADILVRLQQPDRGQPSIGVVEENLVQRLAGGTPAIHRV